MGVHGAEQAATDHHPTVGSAPTTTRRWTAHAAAHSAHSVRLSTGRLNRAAQVGGGSSTVHRAAARRARVRGRCTCAREKAISRSHARCLLARVAGSTAAIIACSANCTVMDQERYLEGGATLCWTKRYPSDEEAFATICSALGAGGGGGAARAHRKAAC